MSKTLSTAEINHLRRLIAWIDCEIGPSADEQIATAKKIAPAVGPISDKAKQRLVDSAEKAAAVPDYVRKAIKALRKATANVDGQIVDAELSGAALPPPSITQ